MPYDGLLAGRRGALARLAATGGVLFGLIALAGWSANIPLLRSVIPGAVQMKANAAVCLILCGAALLILAESPSHRLERFGQAIAALAGLIALATLYEYVFTAQLGLDELLFQDTASAFNTRRGRMSPYSTVAIAALAVALLAMRRPRAVKLRQLGAGVSIFIGALSVLGYLWNASELTTETWLPPVAINTAVAFMLLGFGVLVANPFPARARDERLAALARVEIKILGGLLFSFFLLLLAGGFAYRAQGEYADTVRQIAHSLEFRSSLNELLGEVASAEAAERDYLLTGIPTRRADYLASLKRARTDLSVTARLTAGDATQAERLATLQVLVEARFALLAKILDAYDSAGLAQAEKLIAQGEGARATADLRAALESLDREETRLLGERTKVSGEVRQTTLISLLTSVTLAALVFVLLFKGIHREMVARGEAEEALRTSELYNRSIVESSPDCLALLTLDTRLVEMTAQGRRLMEVENVSAIEDIDWLDLWKERDRDRALAAIDTARGGSAGRFQGYCPTFAGTPKWWDVIVVPIKDALGRPERLLAIARDISEVKHAEDELRQKNIALRQADQAKDAFLAGMSHELRTPLNSVIGFTGTLLMRLPGPLTADQEKQLKTIQGSAKHLLALINDLLDLAKIGAGKVELDLQPTVVQSVAHEVAEMLRPQADAKGLALEIEMPDDEVKMRTDQRILSQIILNLLTNAIKFTEEGCVHLALGTQAGDAKPSVVVTVEDTGVGIRPEDQAQLFSAFRQVRSPMRKQQPGTGLGLHLSRQLAELLGGSLSCQSELGRGSTFTLALPVEGPEVTVTI